MLFPLNASGSCSWKIGLSLPDSHSGVLGKLLFNKIGNARLLQMIVEHLQPCHVIGILNFQEAIFNI